MATYPVVTFGEVTFDRVDIKSATVIEEFNPLSIVVPVNRFEVVIHSDDADFSILNPAGNYSLLQYRQPLTVYQYDGAKQVFMGLYYLDTWENLSENQIQLNCMDEIGLLDTLTYYGGIWLTPITAYDLLTEIFSNLDTEFVIDPNLEDVEVTGWLPISSYREAIQQVAFAIGAYVTCARQQGVIKFGYPAQEGEVTKGIVTGVGVVGRSRLWSKKFRKSQWDFITETISVPKEQQSLLQKINLRTQVTGVEVSAHDISEGTATRQLFTGELAAGTYTITWNQPMHTLSISGATITTSGANYATISVASLGTVDLSGLVYIDSVRTVGVYTEGTKKKDNIVTIEEASLVNSGNAEAVAQRVFDYYQLRHVQELKLLQPSVQIGSKVVVDTLYDQQIEGTVEKLSIDLSNGFLADAEIVGSPVVV